MITFNINKNSSGIRADRFLFKATTAPSSLIYKAFRKKDVKINGHWIREDYTLSEGERLDIYIDSSFRRERTAAHCTLTAPVVYEDGAIVIFDKPPQLPCQPDSRHKTGSLADMLKSYLAETGAYNAAEENAFSPALCNRLDTNTSGLVIGAKTAAALREMNEQIRARRVRKFYKCVLEGAPPEKCAHVHAYIEKDNEKNISRISSSGKEISMDYKVLSSDGKYTVAEVELHTGRSHQIRAYFSSVGCPLAGDKKYGAASGGGQELRACKIIFDFEPGGALSEIAGKTIEI